MRKILNNLSKLFSGYFAFFASLCSFIGLFIIFLSDRNAVFIALGFFCLMLLVFTIYLIFILYKLIKNTRGNLDHENRSTFIKYETEDGNKITYETYKLIQCKTLIMTEMDYSFKWSGTHMPIISSQLQKVKDIFDKKDPNNYDKAILKFNRPIHFNENIIIHFKAELDDSDRKSIPCVETRVTDEIDIIHYRIILKNKPNSFNSNAILERRIMNSTIITDFEKVKEIAFDKKTKSYEYHLLKPEINYFYRIRWSK